MEKALNILIIDDQLELLFAIQEYLLENFKSTTTLATSGNDAISILKRANFFDLIISDFNMPNGDGSTVFKFVQNLSKPVAFIFHSASMMLEEFNGTNFLGTIAKGDRENLRRLIQGHKFD